MKAYVRGKSVYLRETTVDDADFIVRLRTDANKSKHLSPTADNIGQQKDYICRYLTSRTEYYFIICGWDNNPVGTIRIYDIQNDSFCWGSWILSDEAPPNASIESALLIYDFAFYSLHYKKSHFDVRKENQRVVAFHQRFGAIIVREDEINYYFQYSQEDYLKTRQRYLRYLP
ncbi:MAG: GNAT family N-acetyltransferase [Betaproteobacteria bacterium]